MTPKRCILLLSLSLLCSAVLADGIDEPIPSFYQEPGISRTREYSNQHPEEQIDPFTGKLQWHFIDLFIPGNGGMDLKVQRSYTSLAEQWPEANPVGMGWTMHFGRVLRRASVGICFTNSPAYQNPVLELPDGSRRVLYVALGGGSFVTTDFWKAECDLSASGGGLKVYSPDGTTYNMTTAGVSFGSPNNTQNVYYTTQITDRNGNWMRFAYDLVATGGAAVTGITTSDGRNVTFTYTSGALSSVSDGARTWNYVQAVAPGTANNQLVEVKRPDSTSWKYDYNDGSGAAGSYSMRRVTYPQGGTIDYTYDFVQFASNPSIPRSTVVTQKLANPGGTWTWAYTPASQPIPLDANGDMLPVTIPPATPQIFDQTTVTGPDESRTYYHMGYTSVTSGYVYAIGTLLGTSSPVQNESYGFRYMHISNQTNLRPGGTLIFDSVTAAVLNTGHSVGRASESFSTTFSNFDSFANPQTVTETGTDTRTTNLTYFVDPSKWILRLRKSESIQQGTETYPVVRTFDPNGNVLSESRAGVVTNYTYTSEGEVASRTDARNNTTSFSNYFRGIARSENQPEGVAVSRVVDGAGNVTAQTDGEQATTSFTYDGLNRVTGVTHPVGNPVAIDWGQNTRRVTRGALTELTTYDGFGREISVQHTDTGSGQTVAQTYRVDSLGRRVFASYPNAAIGTGFAFDMLNRPTLVLNEYTPGGSFISYRQYSHSGYSTWLLNERGLYYVYRYRAFGDPDKRELVGISDPVSKIEDTVMSRNVAGQITSVSLDGVSRTYGYDSKFFLTSVVEPETGTATIVNDEVGNMVSRQVGSAQAIGYAYDGRNRLTAINYPAGTPSVVKTYYKDDKIKSVDNGVAIRSYQYDGNKNLTSETMTMGAKSFAIGYAYDGNDAHSTLTYGSGRLVSYSPDAFGRPTQVGAYVTSVAYHPNGQPSNFVYGNGVQTTVGLNNRQWPASMRISKGTDLMNSSYRYDEVGNVASMGDSVDGSYGRSMTYDGLDRLTGVSGPWGDGFIGYDMRGNITSQNLGPLSLTYTYDLTTQRLTSVSGSKSYSVAYDALGNVTNTGAMGFNYDAASNMRCAKCGQADQTLFDYDGTGQRVHQQKGATETYFVHGQSGQLLWEETPGASLKEYIYFHGKTVATREQPLQ